MGSPSPFHVLPKTHIEPTLHPHEAFDDAQTLEALLRSTVRGEVRFDTASRALYATDASNYRQVPIGLVVPLDAADVEATIAACRKLGAPVLSRGAGTSLAGQCCNVAVILDFSKHLHGILELDPDGKSARVQPGIVLDALRLEAERFELTFAPDPATHSRCTLGGMIGNNSCGVHALMGGKTVDNIQALEVLLYDGTKLRVGPTPEPELERIIAAGGRRGEIYRRLRQLRDTYADLIRSRFPDIPRRVSGFNLDQLLPENGFNVARALVGSEGTCVTILEALCELKPSPQHRRLVVLSFEDAFIAADAVPEVLAFHPIGLEGFDGLLVEYMRRKSLALDDVKLLPPGGGFLLCEFGADSPEDVDAQVAQFLPAAQSFQGNPTLALYSEDEAKRVWKVRESGLGASVFVPGDITGYEGWEDAAVPPAALGAYLRELYALIRSYGYTSPIYGHFGQGCVHLRITFDLESPAGIANYRRFIDQAADIVLKYGGSFSGEHGDGQSRACLLPKMFGEELMGAFREFKAIWDPTNKMNPGKLIDPVAVYDAVDNLRTIHKGRDVPTLFQFPEDHGSFAHATGRCVGVGACRKTDHGTMCPSYMATTEERHSTRGRAHLLWELMHGDTIADDWKNEQVHEALDLCLSCKACKTECPVGVDMASWKSEFLSQHYQGRLHPLHHYAFGFMDRFASLGSNFGSLPDAAFQLPGLETLVKRVLGVAPQRHIPRLAGKSFRAEFHSSTSARHSNASSPVLLWADTWNNYFQPDALRAARELLESNGHSVQVSPNHVCCGRPLYDFGFLKQARSYLEGILDQFADSIDAGIPVVMLEPSCASVFRDELLNFFPNNPRATKLSQQTMLLSELLAKQSAPRKVASLPGRRIVVHGHCHQKSLMTMKDDLALLRETGASVELLDSGCCGMAGPFGFEKDKFAVSQTLAERVLLPAVRSAKTEDILVSNGFSCREQVAQNSDRRAVHLAQVLAGRC